MVEFSGTGAIEAALVSTFFFRDLFPAKYFTPNMMAVTTGGETTGDPGQTYAADAPPDDQTAHQ